MKWLLLAFKNAQRNRRRSLVTGALAAVGTTAMLLFGGFALQTYNSLEEMSARDSGHLTLAHRDYFVREEDSPMQYSIDDYQTVAKRLLSDARVKAVIPRVQMNGLISNGDKSVVFVGTGVDPREFELRGPFVKLEAGELLSKSEADEVVLGKDLAATLHVEPGSSITLMTSTVGGSLSAVDLIVRGVVSYGVPEIDKRAVLTHVATAQRLLDTTSVNTLSVYLTDMALTDTMHDVVHATLPGYAIKTWLEQAAYYQSVRGIYDRIFGLMRIVLYVMVLFAVYNTLAMAVVERTREIGTLRALGTEPKQLVRLFAMEGGAIAGTGAFVGLLSALVISAMLMVANVQMPPPPGRSTGYPLLVAISPMLYLKTFVVVTLVAGLAAWWVSRRAARKPVTEALSHV